MEDRERRERTNNLVIKGLTGKGRKNLIESVQKFLEEEFEVKGGVKEMQIAGGEGREVKEEKLGEEGGNNEKEKKAERYISITT